MVEAGISDTDVFIAATGKDSLNGLAAQRAKIVYRVDKVLTVVKDEGARTLYESLGITTINRASLTSDQLVNELAEEA